MSSPDPERNSTVFQQCRLFFGWLSLGRTRRIEAISPTYGPEWFG